MKKLISFLENKNNFLFIVKELKINNIDILNKLYEIGVRENECIEIQYNKKNNKNIVFIVSRKSKYAFRIDELDNIFGVLNE